MLPFPFGPKQLLAFDRGSTYGDVVSSRWWVSPGGERLTDTIPGKKARELADALLDVPPAKRASLGCLAVARARRRTAAPATAGAVAAVSPPQSFGPMMPSIISVLSFAIC